MTPRIGFPVLLLASAVLACHSSTPAVDAGTDAVGPDTATDTVADAKADAVSDARTDVPADVPADIPADLAPADLAPETVADALPADATDVPAADALADADAADVPPLPPVRKGPYLQQVTDSSVHVLLETLADDAPDAHVEVGLAAGGPTQTVAFAFSEILKDSEFAPPPGTFQGVAVLDGLQPAQDYHYCAIVADWSRCDTFRTAPQPGSNTPFHFVVYGDTRTDNEAHQRVVDHIVDGTPHPDFTVQTGDLDEIGSDLDLWQTFFDIEQRLLSSSPYYPVVGNHEDILWGMDYFQAWFDLPAPLGDELDYSFVHGNAAFVALDTEVDVTTGPIFDWMVGELARFQAAGYHVFVVTHDPIYTFSNHAEYAGGVEILAPVFEQYGVESVFSGHNHLYEHFLANGVNYLTLGGGGAPLYAADTDIIDGQQQYEVMALSVHHHMNIAIDGPKTTYTAVNDDEPGVIETFEVTQPPPPVP